MGLAIVICEQNSNPKIRIVVGFSMWTELKIGVSIRKRLSAAPLPDSHFSGEFIFGVQVGVSRTATLPCCACSLGTAAFPHSLLGIAYYY